jgi:hypothetical protein
MELDLILFWGQCNAGKITRMSDESDKPKRGRPVGRPVGTRNRAGTQKPGRKPKPRAREKRVASLGERAQISVALSQATAAKLASIAQKWRVTRGEVVRRLIDRAEE